MLSFFLTITTGAAQGVADGSIKSLLSKSSTISFASVCFRRGISWLAAVVAANLGVSEFRVGLDASSPGHHVPWRKLPDVWSATLLAFSSPPQTSSRPDSCIVASRSQASFLHGWVPLVLALFLLGQAALLPRGPPSGQRTLEDGDWLASGIE